MDEQHSYLNTRVCVFNTYPIWGGGEKWHYTAACFFEREGLEVYAVVHPEGELAKKLQKDHQEIKLNLFLWNKHSYFNPFAIVKLYKFFKDHKIQTVIFNAPQDVRVGALPARLAGVENIIYRNGMPVPIADKLTFRLAFRFGLTDIVPVSYEIRRMMKEQTPFLCAGHEMKNVIYNAVDLHRYNFENVVPKFRNFALNKDIVLLGNSARLCDQKGQIHLLEMAKILKDKNISFRLLIAGEGELEQNLKRIAKEFEIEDVVEFLGFVEDIPSFLRSLDLYVFTSFWEATASSLVEALAFKLPIVCFDMSSMPEVVEHGVNGFLAKPCDSEDLAEKVATLIFDQALALKMGEAGYEKMKQDFSFEKNYARWLKICQQRSSCK